MAKRAKQDPWVQINVPQNSGLCDQYGIWGWVTVKLSTALQLEPHGIPWRPTR